MSAQQDHSYGILRPSSSLLSVRAGSQTGAIRYSAEWWNLATKGALELYGQSFNEPGSLMSPLPDVALRRVMGQPSVADKPTSEP